MLSMKENSSYHYDSEFDILDYIFNNQKNSYGDEEPDNIIVFRDLDTDEITGIRILDFKKMYMTKDYRLKVAKQLIDIEKIVKIVFS